MRCAIPTFALWLAALASCAVAQDDEVTLPSLNDVTGDSDNSTATGEFVELSLLALDTVPDGIKSCTKNPDVLVGVSVCFTQAEVNTIAQALNTALGSSTVITYFNNNENEHKYRIGSYKLDCPNAATPNIPSGMSILKPFTGGKKYDLYVNVAKAKERSLTPKLGYYGYSIDTTFDIRVCADLACTVDSSDALSATLAGVGAYANQIKSLANCGCLKGSTPETYTSDQNKKQCKCSCSGGREAVDGACTCTGGRTFVDNACTCTGGRSFVDGQCKCSGGQVFDGTTCNCPVKQHLDEGVCVPDCFWKAGGGGYTCLWTDQTKTSLKLKDDCQVVAPVPNDNYVNDMRTNKNDAQVADPTITINSQSRFTGSVKDTQKTTWLDYATTPGNLENKVLLSEFGVYDLGMVATDYRYNAKCVGCVAVIDNYGPKAIQTCKTTDTCSSNVVYSDANLAAVIAEETKFTSFYAESNIKNNGDYNPVTGANERTDLKTAKGQNFFCDNLLDFPSTDYTCFTNDYVKDLLDKSRERNDLASSVAVSNKHSSLQCKRCCSKSRTLREYYYQYTCSGTPEKKIRSTDSCTYGQCLTMKPTTLVTASATTTTGSNTKTQTTLNGLSPIPAFVASEIHRSFKCTGFDKGCTVTPTLGDLFSRTTDWGVTVPAGYDVNEFVHWRYSVGTEHWKVWSDSDVLTFADQATDVTLQAWSYCGMIYETKFKVILHPHTTRDACKGFASRWVENSPSPRTVESHMCTYPNSDFAMLTFNYDSTENVNTDMTTKVKGKYTNAQCKVTLAESGQLSSAAARSIPLTVSPDTNGKFTFAKQFGLELVHEPSTAKNTDVKLECTFTFSHYDTDATDNEDESCSHSFTITDCDHPTVQTKNTEGLCAVGQCLTPSGIPGPYEACAGDVFTAVGASTTLKAVTSQCCSDCKTSLACAAMAQSAVNGVNRCEAATPAFIMMATGDAIDMAQSTTARGADTSTMTALAGVSALVAIVALVVVKVRASRPKMALDDAYVSMLD